MNLSRPQLALKRRCIMHAAKKEAGFWGLAAEALEAKRQKIPDWEAVIGGIPDVLKEERTIRDWARAAEWREIVRKATGRLPTLPFSHYLMSMRYADRLSVDRIIDAMLDAEQNSTRYGAYSALLAQMADEQAEIVSDGGNPPNNAHDSIYDFFITPLAWLRAERQRLVEFAALPEAAPALAHLSAAAGELDAAMKEIENSLTAYTEKSIVTS